MPQMPQMPRVPYNMGGGMPQQMRPPMGYPQQMQPKRVVVDEPNDADELG